MPSSARCCAVLLPLLATPALAQADGAMPRPRSDYRIPAAPSRPVAGGFTATMDAGTGLQLAVGRVRVFEPARLRTHTEPEPMPLDVRRRERGIAAVRLSFSF